MSGLADVDLLIRALFVAFLVGGLALIWIGALTYVPFAIIVVPAFVLFPPIRQVQNKHRSR